MKLLLADFILIVHFGFVLFVVLSLPLIWIGALAGWRWIRNFPFRMAHLTAILFVSAEAVAGIWCPLTLWEDALRGMAQDQGFVARWIHPMMFYRLPEWVFTASYVAFALVVGATLWLLPPDRVRK